MKHLITALAMIGLTACSAATDAPIETKGHDADLAQSLGADNYGMRSYIMVILNTGPNDKTIANETERADIFKGHFSTIKSLAEAKHLVVAGPLSDPDGVKRGLFILNVKTVEEAKALVLSDPAVKAGIFTPDFTPYYGSAALMQVNETHARIAKENPG